MLNDKLIFYVDDDVEDIETFLEITDDIEHLKVNTYTRGDDALNTLKANHNYPSVIFLDLNMPGKNGYQVLQEIKSDKKLKDLPVIIFSTSGDEFSINKTKELGADYYMCKPNSFNKLREYVNYALHMNWQNHNPQQNFFHKI